jgi:hypothetical protein
MCRSLQGWNNDVFLVFDNAVEFDEENSIIDGSGIYLKRKTEKFVMLKSTKL